MRTTAILAAVGAVALTGCSSMSGYDAKSQFSCKAPDGVLCESMTGIYANGMANNLPGQRVTHGGGKNEATPAKLAPGSGVLTKPIYSGTPIRTAPLVLRVWFAPWEDTDGDLHDQSYVYLTVDSGKWLIEHNRRRIQDSYRPVRAPNQAGQVSSAQAAANAKIKVNLPGRQPASVNDEPPPPQQTAQDLLQGLLRPEMPGTPQQLPGDSQ